MRFPAITGYRESTPVKQILTLGAYTARSLIAEAQRCINLYPEINPQDAPFPTTHYPTPGLTLWSSAPANVAGEARGLYYSTRNVLYTVVGQNLYTVSPGGGWNFVGALETRTGPVNMVDNGNVLLVVDGPSKAQAARSPVAAVQPVPSDLGVHTAVTDGGRGAISQPVPSMGQPPGESYWAVGNVVQLPGMMECSIQTLNVSGGNEIVVLALAYTSIGGEPYGYAVGFYDAKGQQCGQIFKVVGGAFEPIGTFTQQPNLTQVPTGVHTMAFQITSYGQMYLWIDEVLQAQALDSTYKPTGQLWYGSPSTVTEAKIAPVKALNPAVYIVDLATQKFASLAAGDIYGATHIDYLDTFFVLNYPGTQLFYSTNSNIAFIDTEAGPIQTAALTTSGSGYKDGTYNANPLTGGTGSGATADITVAGGAVTAVVLDDPGTGYEVGDVLSASLPAAGSVGPIQTLKLATPGAGLAPGTYSGVALTGGTGSGATATIVVASTPVTGGFTTYPPRMPWSPFLRAPGAFGGDRYLESDRPLPPVDRIYTLGGVVTSVTLDNAGTGYTADDVLSCALGFAPVTPGDLPIQRQPTFKVAVINPIPAQGFEYTVSAFSNLNAFNALNIAAKTGFADELLALIVVHREVWLFGRQTTEVWTDTGGIFPFSLSQGVFLQRGIIAPYSLCKSDLTPLWLGRDQNGSVMVFQGISYNAVRISTHAIEQEIQQYVRVDDATAFVYQQDGHTFYVINFPTADRTWVYDLATQLWHQRATVDADGTLHRHLPNAYTPAYDLNICQRWDTGDLMLYDTTVYNDLGGPVTRVRGFPHIKNEMRRIIYNHFIADMEVGQAPAVSDAIGVDIGIYPVLYQTLVFALIESGDGLASYQKGAQVGLPGKLDFDVELVAGSILNILLYSGVDSQGRPNGYFLRIDTRIGYLPVQFLRVTSGSWSDIFTGLVPVNSQVQEGLHHITATFNTTGSMLGTYDEKDVASAQDTTYINDLTGQVYLASELVTGSSISPSNLGTYPLQINLHWSDDGGQSWNSPIPMTLESGAYNQLVKWNRLGMGRDRVFEVFWTTSIKTALNGAWATIIDAAS